MIDRLHREPRQQPQTLPFQISMLACAVVLGASCAHKPPPVSPAAVGPVHAETYFDAYATWTRSDELFTVRSMNDVLHATATWETLPFRLTYIERYCADYAVPATQKSQLVSGAHAEAAREQRFFVTVSGDDYRETDLTHKRTAWQVVLVDSHNQAVQPLRVEKISKPTPALRTYFPSVSPHRQTFRLYFPSHLAGGRAFPTVGAKYVTLRFTGALGAIDLRWDLK